MSHQDHPQAPAASSPVMPDTASFARSAFSVAASASSAADLSGVLALDARDAASTSSAPCASSGSSASFADAAMDGVIRPVEEKDWPAVYAIYAWYVENTVWNFEWEPRLLDAFVQEQKEIARCYPYYVAEKDGWILGYGLAHQAFGRISYQFDAEFTIYFMPGAHYGLPSKMTDHICEDLKKQNVHWLIGCITASNAPSIAFHKKHGFVFQGKLPEAGWKNGAFHDVVWYGKELRPKSWYTSQERRFIPRHALPAEKP